MQIQKINKMIFNHLKSVLDFEFKESDHPRDKSGKFSSGSSGCRRNSAEKNLTKRKINSKKGFKSKLHKLKDPSVSDGTYDLETGLKVEITKGYQFSFSMGRVYTLRFSVN